MAKRIKLYDGVTVLCHGKATTLEYIPDLWDVLNVPNKDDRLEITRNLIATGSCELLMKDHTKCYIQLIPAKEE